MGKEKILKSAYVCAYRARDDWSHVNDHGCNHDHDDHDCVPDGHGCAPDGHGCAPDGHGYVPDGHDYEPDGHDHDHDFLPNHERLQFDYLNKKTNI